VKSHPLRRQNFCPRCREILDFATNAQLEVNRSPQPGALTVCLYCGAALRFGQRLELVLMSREEILGLPDESKRSLLQVSLVCAALRAKLAAEK
jgi:RNase P subunit RPR2